MRYVVIPEKARKYPRATLLHHGLSRAAARPARASPLNSISHLPRQQPPVVFVGFRGLELWGRVVDAVVLEEQALEALLQNLRLRPPPSPPISPLTSAPSSISLYGEMTR